MAVSARRAHGKAIVAAKIGRIGSKLRKPTMDVWDHPIMKWSIRIWGLVLLSYGIVIGWHLHAIFQ